MEDEIKLSEEQLAAIDLDKLGKQILDSIEVSNLNSDGPPPYAFYSPESEGKVRWFCALDEEGKYTSVFVSSVEGDNGRITEYLKNETECKFYRDELLNNGWKPIPRPKMVFRLPNGESREV